MVAWLVGAVTQLIGYWLPAGHAATSPSASGLMALAAVALTGMLVAFLAHGARIAAAVTARPLVRAARCARSPGRRRSSGSSIPTRRAGPAPGALGGPGGRLTIRTCLAQPPVPPGTPPGHPAGSRGRLQLSSRSRTAGGSVMLSLFGVAVGAAYHVVSALAQVLAPVPGAWPPRRPSSSSPWPCGCCCFRSATTRSAARPARPGWPHVQALRKRHAGHPDRLQRELAALYQREGTGMFAGCLPLLLQLPFLSVMYPLFRSGTIGGRPNSLLGHDLLGAPLGSHWLSGPGPLSAQGAVFLGLFALLAVAAWLAARVARKIAAHRRRASPRCPAPPAGWPGRCRTRRWPSPRSCRWRPASTC